ncbi:MAG: hypothetical protein VX990_05055, partial [Pseudomonadota bacterium]|nr:hypothetical protein [Pseudomonadota bacterium]
EQRANSTGKAEPGPRFCSINVTESLEVGNLADFACLSGDSLSVPEDEIKDIVPKFTVLDCKIVYQGTDA